MPENPENSLGTEKQSDWDRYQKIRDEVKARCLKKTLPKVCDALRGLGVAYVDMEYEGGGDSGEYTHPVARDNENNIVSLIGTCTKYSPVTTYPEGWGGLLSAATKDTDNPRRSWDDVKVTDGAGTVELFDLVNTIMCTAVEISYPGWEVNSGARGTVSFEVDPEGPTGSLKIQHSRFVTETYDHETCYLIVVPE